MKISLVAAIGENFELGGNGDLLWRLPNDMKRFKAITTGHHVVMGRKTYESLPPKFRPLPNRVNIIITSNSAYVANDCVVVNSIEQAVSAAQQSNEEELMIIGGAQVYNLALPLAHRLYITKVHAAFQQADVFFPKWKDDKWQLTKSESFPADEQHEYAYDFLTYERIR